MLYIFFFIPLSSVICTVDVVNDDTLYFVMIDNDDAVAII